MRSNETTAKWGALLWIAPLAAVALPCASAYSAEEQRDEISSTHVQATFIPQGHGAFDSPYSGSNSLSASSEWESTETATLFQGYRLWNMSEIYVNPEMTAGSGLSGTHGIAAFTNGEAFRVSTPDPRLDIARIYFRQSFSLGGQSERIEAGKNQLAGSLPSSRISLTVGKFGLADFFDNNAYSHDPRTQFMNWALMSNAAWDYAADSRGYTWGLMLELALPSWAARIAFAQVPTTANGDEIDEHLTKAYSVNAEVELGYSAAGHPGRARLLGWANHATMGNYAQALALSPSSPDVTATREYSSKYGFGLNLEQELGADLGAFLRAGWSDGATETWCFTEVDRTLSGGLSMKGTPWGRQDDVLGLALAIDGLSADHANSLAAGGLGFLLGDGALDYAPEQALEAYYSWQTLRDLALTLDVQRVSNPGYNRDRGPVTVFSARAHYEF